MSRVVVRWFLTVAVLAALLAVMVSFDGGEWMVDASHALVHFKIFAAIGHVIGLAGKAGKIALIAVVAAVVAVNARRRRRISSRMSSESPALPPTVSDPPKAG
ncbi:hypothetical protein NS506_07162 [Nocardia seriolae]|uniref:Uncharacterized protein n=2 Tax=Nocardia seriolae TaxID=37332 RepID=A0ABC9YR47_9NOCA|nr:hypothetical protein NS506_07162 [Nocardia seriolae]GEM23531.1 hypothetical protein NS2_17700 [Nocardia seriolae NBRC 15557]OJF78665.1 hypothetical protein NS14008_04780 [Nocardia seriolae]PSK31362.1 hypothetical protein C6575_10615 [Nocardia seriolae]BEK90768.1 hypothetical protein NSERKGN1266_67190 [Nocardia seriolae]